MSDFIRASLMNDRDCLKEIKKAAQSKNELDGYPLVSYEYSDVQSASIFIAMVKSSYNNFKTSTIKDTILNEDVLSIIIKAILENGNKVLNKLKTVEGIREYIQEKEIKQLCKRMLNERKAGDIVAVSNIINRIFKSTLDFMEMQYVNYIEQAEDIEIDKRFISYSDKILRAYCNKKDVEKIETWIEALEAYDRVNEYVYELIKKKVGTEVHRTADILSLDERTIVIYASLVSSLGIGREVTKISEKDIANKFESEWYSGVLEELKVENSIVSKTATEFKLKNIKKYIAESKTKSKNFRKTAIEFYVDMANSSIERLNSIKSDN